MEFLYMDDSNLFHSHFIINKKINELQLHIKDLEMKRKNNDTFLTFHDNQFQKKITKYQSILNKCKLDMIKKSILIYNNNIDIRNIKKEIQKNNEVLVLNTIKNKLDELYSSNLLKNRTYINNKKKIEESFLDDYILNTINSNADGNTDSLNNGLDNSLNNSLNNIIKQNLLYELKKFLKIKLKNDKIYKKIDTANIKLLTLLNKKYIQNEKSKNKANFSVHKYKYNYNYYNSCYTNYGLSLITYNCNKDLIENKLFIYSFRLNELKKEYILIEKSIEINNNKYGKKINNTDTICAICLDDIEYGITTKCNHIFHFNCMNMYVYNLLDTKSLIKILCPICRQYI
jgi:hypothetical protein